MKNGVCFFFEPAFFTWRYRTPRTHLESADDRQKAPQNMSAHPFFNVLPTNILAVSSGVKVNVNSRDTSFLGNLVPKVGFRGDEV